MRISRYLRFWLAVAGGALAARGGASELLNGLVFGSLPPREVRVYLPPGKVTAATPILVALDGQAMPAWKLEEAIAALAGQHQVVAPLVIAISSGEERLDEYGMAGMPDYAGHGRKSAAFQHFVLEVVLPTVRMRYKIQPDPSRTGVMGASLGGLAAFDLAWNHPETFGFAGIFSGSLWWRSDDSTPAKQQSSRLVHRLVRTTEPPPSVRLWFEAGTQDETADRDGNGVIDAIQDTTELMADLERHHFRRGADVEYVEIAGGRHDDATWARALPGFLEWALPRD